MQQEIEPSAMSLLHHSHSASSSSTPTQNSLTHVGDAANPGSDGVAMNPSLPVVDSTGTDTDTDTTSTVLLVDPHMHPTPIPPPASALAIFKLAHRYNLEALCQLASIHLISTLTPTCAFPLLLATSVYQDLHAKIKSYVHHHWHLVSDTLEFERCCDEVSSGECGFEAGKALRLFMKSLVSPVGVASST